MSRPLRVKVARGFLDRLCGVGWSVEWRNFDALCLPRCRAVHTFALATAIDVVFVSPDQRITQLRTRVAPWRIVSCDAAEIGDIWEFPEGCCQAAELTVGMSLEEALLRLGARS